MEEESYSESEMKIKQSARLDVAACEYVPSRGHVLQRTRSNSETASRCAEMFRVKESENQRTRSRWRRAPKDIEETTHHRVPREITGDMTISGSCRHLLSLPVMFWTSLFILLLARGVYCGEEQSKFERFSRLDPNGDAQGYSTPDGQETYNIVNILRELIQRYQQRGNQQVQVYTNGEDLSENQIDWRKIPLPLLYQIRAIINDGIKDKDKRGSYMLPCHFKVCNLG